jgi:hypothetical protein
MFRATFPHAPGAALLFSLTLAVAGTAGAQEYRSNMPEVLGQEETRVQPVEPARDVSAVTRSFREAYARQGRPRIAVFWNRHFSDRLSQWVTAGRALVTREWDAGIAVDDSYGSRSAEISSEEASAAYVQRNAPESRRPGMGALADAEFETGFSGPMLSAAVKLIDRATIMRVTESNLGRRRGDDRVPDAQVIETEALKDFADYIAEVTMLPDADAPREQAFRIVVKSIPEGRIVASMLARGPEPVGDPGWEATSGGYQRAEAPAPSVSAIGTKVAYDMMDALSRVW